MKAILRSGFLALAIGIGVFCAHTATFAGELHDAVRAGDKAAVESLLVGGADVDENDYILGTALHIAVSQGNVDIAKILIDQGADLQAASEQQGARALHLAAAFNDIVMLALLLDSGADTESRDDDHRTPLFRAAIPGHTEAVRLLLDRGAELEARDGIRARTPFMMASYFGRLNIVELLIDRGADINATDTHGESALSFAVGITSFYNAGGPALIEYLVANGADLNVKNNAGLTPLAYAKRRGPKETPGVLRRLGAME